MANNPNVRLEAFCDGVFAIAMTLLIIDIKLPPATPILSTGDFWHALHHLAPAVFAFLLSFTIIFITWVNHHGALKLVHKSSGPFIYANGFLMLGVVLVPFPTALLGENLMTSHASPAVVLYCGAGAIMGIGWALIGWTALKPQPLTRDERASARVRTGLRNAYIAIAYYIACAIVAVWLPLAIAVVITLQWAYWVIYGIRSAGEPASE